jgi:hypothetical protein
MRLQREQSGERYAAARVTGRQDARTTFATALRNTSGSTGGSDRDAVLQAAQGHVIAAGEIVGL